MINTALGEISPAELGVTSSHEHVLIDMRHCVDVTGNEPEIFFENITLENRGEVLSDPYAILDNALLSEIDKAVWEMKFFKQFGGNTVVDCTLDEIGRDPLALRLISEKSGVNIIIGSGHYYHKAHAPYVKHATVSDLADEIRRDLTVGIGDTGIKAGIIGEIGTSAVISEDEYKCLRAAGIASAECDRPIHVHTDLYTENGFDIINTLVAEGARPERICIDHVDVLLRPDYVRGLLDLGVYVEFDDFGKEFYVNRDRRFAYDLERIHLLRQLINEGYGDRILLCNDVCLKTMWRSYGGPGYAHILRTVKQMAIENGISEDRYNSILTDNVRAFLS